MARGLGVASSYDEQELGKVFDRRLARRLWPYLRPYRWLVTLAIGFAVLTSALKLVGPLIVKHVIDRYIPAASPENARMVTQWSLFYFALLGVVFVTNFALVYTTQWVGQRALYALRRDIFEKLHRLPLSFFDRTPTGRLLTRSTSDANVLNDLFSQGVVNIFADFVMLIGIVIIWLWYAPRLGVLLFLISPIMIVGAYNFRIRARTAYRAVRTRLSVLNSYLQENLAGIRTVQAFNREDTSHARYCDMNRVYTDAQIDTVRQFAQFFPLVEVVRILAMAVVFGYAGYIAYQTTAPDPTRFTEGDFVLYFQLIAMFFMPIRDLAERYNIFQSAMASAERIFLLLDEDESVADPPLPEGERAPEILPPLERSVGLRDVWFHYKENEWVLKGVSLEVRKGQRVALVGATGAGKSTVINLLSRLYDVQRGEVLYDGMDVRKLPQDALRRRMAIVLQDVFLFSGTIRDNIRMGNEKITDEQVERAARLVNAHSFIEKLAGGYDHPVLERGATLSTGQKQLLAFARALAFDPDILILDEATSNIDTETEALIQDALERLMEGRTSIVVAHRLSTIQSADRIVVFHHGKIHEEGSHQELLARDGLYRRLYELQYKV